MMDSYLFESTSIKNRNTFSVSLIDTVERSAVSPAIPPRQHNITMVNQSGIPYIISLCRDLSCIVDDMDVLKRQFQDTAQLV
jgi:hypothetical protein